MMSCFQPAKQNCPKKADECCDQAYLAAQHAKVKCSKKAIHDKTKDTFNALNKSSSFRPSQLIPTTSLVQFQLVQAIVPVSHLFPILPPFLYTVLMTLPIITTICRDRWCWTQIRPMVEFQSCISGLNLRAAIHSDCVVTSSLILQDGSKNPSRTLADTGCTRDKFMSESHFQAHPVLQQYIVQHPTNTIIDLANGSTAFVSQYISNREYLEARKRLFVENSKLTSSTFKKST